MLDKRKYKKAQVEKMLFDKNCEYNEKIAILKEEIVCLQEKNDILSSENQKLKNEQRLINVALKQIGKNAEEVKSLCDTEFITCKLEISNFLKKWNKYFEYLEKKYPFYPYLKQINALKQELGMLLEIDDFNEFSKSASKSLEELEKATFNPKDKIQDYIVATSDNGFDMNEVLNPGALQLEDLCKELGLLEENE